MTTQAVRWAYRTVNTVEMPTDEQMNAWGEDGWEIISVNEALDFESWNTTMKRPVNAGPHAERR